MFSNKFLKFSYEDMCAIGAACGTMSVQMLKEADCLKDFYEAAHLADLYRRIDKALQEFADECNAKEKGEGEAKS